MCLHLIIPINLHLQDRIYFDYPELEEYYDFSSDNEYEESSHDDDDSAEICQSVKGTSCLDIEDCSDEGIQDKFFHSIFMELL